MDCWPLSIDGSEWILVLGGSHNWVVDLMSWTDRPKFKVCECWKYVWWRFKKEIGAIEFWETCWLTNRGESTEWVKTFRSGIGGNIASKLYRFCWEVWFENFVMFEGFVVDCGLVKLVICSVASEWSDLLSVRKGRLENSSTKFFSCLRLSFNGFNRYNGTCKSRS